MAIKTSEREQVGSHTVEYGDWFSDNKYADRSRCGWRRRVKVDGFFGKISEAKEGVKRFKTINGKSFKTLEAAIKAVAA